MPATIELEEVGSTNDWLAERAWEFGDGQWVSARRQSAGRGRMGRAWQAPPGNLSASCLILPRPAEGAAHELSLVLALALFDTTAQFVPAARLGLKWPNDLLLDGAKLSGILLERVGDAVIAGVGVNLVAAPALPDRPTIALGAAMAGPPPAPRVFLARLAERLEAWRVIWASRGFAAIREAWLAAAHPIGAAIMASVGGKTISGHFAGLGDDGALLLADEQGKVHVIRAGDVMVNPAVPGKELD